MKKIIVSLLIIVAASFALASCNSKESHTYEAAEKVQYTCPMHPEVISDKPGQCPKCKMDLVKKESTSGTSSDSAAQHHDHNH